MIKLLTQIRSVIGVAFLIPYTVLCAVLIISAAAFDKQRFANKLVRLWSGRVLGFFGIKVYSSGEKNLPAHGGGIIVFNHQSHFDIPVLAISTKKVIRFGAKIELFSIPFFGQAIRALGTLPITRDNRKEVMRVYEQAAKRFKQDILFVLAPEGTRQKEPAIGRFKKGPFIFAIDAGVPIIPAVIRGAHRVLPKNSLMVNVGALTRDVEVEFLPAVQTTGLTHDDLDALTARVRESFVAAYRSEPAAHASPSA